MLVFALNTVVSFACSVGLVDFSKDHHKHDATHSHDTPQSHEKASNHHGRNVETGNHQHSASKNHHLPSEEENNCCSDNVLKVSMLDKAVTSVNQDPVPLPVEVMAAIYSCASCTFRLLSSIRLTASCMGITRSAWETWKKRRNKVKTLNRTIKNFCIGKRNCLSQWGNAFS